MRSSSTVVTPMSRTLSPVGATTPYDDAVQPLLLGISRGSPYPELYTSATRGQRAIRIVNVE